MQGRWKESLSTCVTFLSSKRLCFPEGFFCFKVARCPWSCGEQGNSSRLIITIDLRDGPRRGPDRQVDKRTFDTSNQRCLLRRHIGGRDGETLRQSRDVEDSWH